jgi:hypothetical protein
MSSENFDRNTLRGLALSQALTITNLDALTADLAASSLFRGDAVKSRGYARWALKQHGHNVGRQSSGPVVPEWISALNPEQLIELRETWDMLQKGVAVKVEEPAVTEDNSVKQKGKKSKHSASIDEPSIPMA